MSHLSEARLADPHYPPPVTAIGHPGQILVDLDNPSSHQLIWELVRGYLPSFIEVYNSLHSAHRKHKIHGIANAATKDIFKLFEFTPRLSVQPCFDNLKVACFKFSTRDSIFTHLYC
jgi:hypothetical protein